MISLLSFLPFALLASFPAAVSVPLAPEDVVDAARVDKKNRVYIDVQNESRVGIVVTSAVMSFYDTKKTLLEKRTIECETDCAVGAEDAESFGPMDGPKGWATVKVNDVSYDDAAAEEERQKPAVPVLKAKKGASPESKSKPAPSLPPEPLDGRRESLDGYAEWWQNGLLIVDGQRVRLAAAGKFKGKGEVKAFSQIPLGFEVKARGRRNPDGVLEAEEVQIHENGSALFESDLRSAFDEMEQQYLKEHRMYEEDEEGKREEYGKLYTSGPEVERVRGILSRLIPGYLAKRDFRVYVVENKEWNAMAAPNDSIYVFSGLLQDLDDDEVAIVLGHELTHATHEHSRKQFKKGIVIQLMALGVIAVTEESVGDKNKRAVVEVAALLGASAWASGYGRGREDQADRVGLRYANEGGFDVRKGPGLWNRFAKKYGDDPKVLNFFFGGHSVAQDRAKNLTRELALNYPH